MPTFAASLITPERTLVEEEVQAVFMRTDGGDAAFMPGHTPLIAAVVPGMMRFQHEDGTEERAAVHGGFVQVEPDHVNVFAPVAERAQDIDVDRARRALDAATQLVSELGGAGAGAGAGDGAEDTDADRALHDAEAAQRRAEIRLEVAEATDSVGA